MYKWVLYVMLKETKACRKTNTKEYHKHMVHTILLLANLQLQQDHEHEFYLYLFRPTQSSMWINYENHEGLIDAQNNCENIFYLCTQTKSSSITESRACIMKYCSTENIKLQATGLRCAILKKEHMVH